MNSSTSISQGILFTPDYLLTIYYISGMFVHTYIHPISVYIEHTIHTPQQGHSSSHGLQPGSLPNSGFHWMPPAPNGNECTVWPQPKHSLHSPKNLRFACIRLVFFVSLVAFFSPDILLQGTSSIARPFALFPSLSSTLTPMRLAGLF